MNGLPLSSKHARKNYSESSKAIGASKAEKIRHRQQYNPNSTQSCSRRALFHQQLDLVTENDLQSLKLRGSRSVCCSGIHRLPAIGAATTTAVEKTKIVLHRLGTLPSGHLGLSGRVWARRAYLRSGFAGNAHCRGPGRMAGPTSGWDGRGPRRRGASSAWTESAGRAASPGEKS